MDELSLATLLAIEDNSIIHKLRLLPIEELLTLLQLPTAELAQIAATATPDELRWLAGYLSPLPAEQAAAITQGLASGEMTIAALQAPPAAASREAAASNADRTSGESEASAGSLGTPIAGIPKTVIDFTSPLAENGVVVAAGVVVLLLIVVGVVLAWRRDSTHPPL